MDFLDLLKINPRLVDRTVFKHLQRDHGPHDLSNVPHKALIACTSRTGSSLLQVCLERYGLDAREFFNPDGLPKAAAESAETKTLTAYANYLARTAVKGGHFVVKGAYPAFLFLYFLGEAPRLRTGWKIVFLRRRSVIRQAISMCIVEKTQQWTFDMPAKTVIDPNEYAFDAINRFIEVIQHENQLWERIFALLDLRPLRLFYEDLCADVDGVTERTAKFIGIDTDRFPDARAHKPRLEKQSAGLNDEWERRFREDAARLAVPNTVGMTQT